LILGSARLEETVKKHTSVAAHAEKERLNDLEVRMKVLEEKVKRERVTLSAAALSFSQVPFFLVKYDSIFSVYPLRSSRVSFWDYLYLANQVSRYDDYGDNC
jgi:hypothetical protein